MHAICCIATGKSLVAPLQALLSTPATMSGSQDGQGTQTKKGALRGLGFLDSGVQELTALSPLLHYVNCGLPLIRSVCGGEVLDVVRLQTFLCVIGNCSPSVLLGSLRTFAALLHMQLRLQQHLGITTSAMGSWEGRALACFLLKSLLSRSAMTA